MKVNKKRLKEIISEEVTFYKNLKESEKILKKINEAFDKEVEVKKTGEFSDMTIAELKEKVRNLKKENDKFQEEGKKVPESNKKEMGKLLFAIRAKQGWKNEIK